jgi:MFS family permease
VLLLSTTTMFGIFYFSTQYLQDVLGYGPLRTGFAFLPMAGPLFAAARLAPRLLVRHGARRVAGTGAALTLAGVAWVSTLSPSDGYAQVLLPMLVLLGFGVGLTMMPLNTTVLAGVAPQDAGSASGLLQTMQQVGGSLGLSVLVTVFGTVSRHHARDPFVHGAAAAFTLSAAFAALALLLVLALRTPRRTA